MPRWIRWAAAFAFCLALAARGEVTVRVRDDAGQAVAGVTVTLRLHEERKDASSSVVFFKDNVPHGDTNESGTFTANAAAGIYDIVLQGPIVPKEIQQQKVGVGSDVIEVVVDRGVVLSGRVVKADGSAAGKSRVLLEYSPRFSRFVETDETGAFVFSHASRGKVKLTTGLKNAFNMDVVQEVKSPASDVVLRLPATGRIEGKVLDKKTRQPVGDFAIHIERLGGEDEALPSWNSKRQVGFRAKDGGAFAIDLPPGLVELVATAEGYLPEVVRNTEVRASKVTGGVVFQLDRPARIAGRARSRDGSPARGVMVTMMREESIAERTPRTETGESGEYVLENVPAGDYEIEFSGGGFFKQRKSVSVAVGDEARIDVELTPGLEVRGLVVDEAGRPLAAATVSTFGACCNARTETDAKGSFVVKGFEDGSYLFRGEKKGFIDRETRIEVHRERAIDPVTITLAKGGVITGTIRGVPPEDLGKVTVEAQNGGREWGEVDPKTGSFRIESVADGRASVIVMVDQDFRRGARAEVDVRNGVCAPVDIDLAAGWTIKGRVTRKGSPVEGTVTFRTPGSATFIGQPFSTRDGYYEATGIGGGECTVGFQPQRGNRGIFVARTVFTGDDTYDIELHGGLLQGRVIGKASGQPLEGARVTLTGVLVSYYETKIVDRDGRFAFDLLLGRYRITARVAQYLAAETEIEIAEEQAPPVELQLVPAESAILRISDAASGRPVNAQVRIVDRSDRTVSDPYEDRAMVGVYRTWLPPGTYSAIVNATGYAEQRGIPITIPGPEVRIAMTRGGTLVIRSRNRADFQATLTAPTGVRLTMRDMTLNVPPGDCTLIIHNDGVRAESQHPVTIVEGKATLVEIE